MNSLILSQLFDNLIDTFLVMVFVSLTFIMVTGGCS